MNLKYLVDISHDIANQQISLEEFRQKLKLIEALAKVIFVILSEAKDLDSSVAYGSLRMTDM